MRMSVAAMRSICVEYGKSVPTVQYYDMYIALFWQGNEGIALTTCKKHTVRGLQEHPVRPAI